MPEMRKAIMGGRDWKAIAQYQMMKFFSPTETEISKDMESLLNLYGSDVYDQFLGDPKCAVCGDTATQRCSKCKSVWYCTRECQLSHWKEHKALCKIASEARVKHEEREAERKKNMGYDEEKQARAVAAKKTPMIEELS